MKKLILLAIVVFGFAAMSFGQTPSASLPITGQITPKNTPILYVGAIQGMDFGQIVNNATAATVGADHADGVAVMLFLADGSIAEEKFMTHTGTPRPAKFEVKGINFSTTKTANALTFADITLGGGSLYHDTHVWFDTNNTIPGLITFTTNGNDQYGNPQYIVSLGGQLQIDKTVTGAITIPNLTLTVNNR